MATYTGPDGYVHSSSNGITEDSVTPACQVAATSYTLSAADHMQVRAFTNASGCIVTVPKGLGVQFQCALVQSGAGQVTLVPASGVSLNPSTALKTAGQYAVASLLAVGTDSLVLAGNVAA